MSLVPTLGLPDQIVAFVMATDIWWLIGISIPLIVFSVLIVQAVWETFVKAAPPDHGEVCDVCEREVREVGPYGQYGDVCDSCQNVLHRLDQAADDFNRRADDEAIRLANDADGVLREFDAARRKEDTP